MKSLIILVLLVTAVSATYRIESISYNQDDSFNATLALNLPGPSVYEPDFALLKLAVTFDTENRLHFTIKAESPRWEVPFDRKSQTTVVTNRKYDVVVTHDPFSFAIIRKLDGDVLFNATSLVFEDHYLSISAFIGTEPNIYGLGERISSYRLQTNMTYPIFARCQVQRWNNNQYGVHPFYLQIKNSGVSHGVFLLNSNAMGVTIAKDSIQYEIVGGIFDFHVFLGPKPADVVRQYQEVIGKPHFPPYWSLGWHQCRYGYRSLDEIKNVVAEYEHNKIALDAMWVDIEYMDQHRDFTTDPIKYPQNAFEEWLNSTIHHKHKKFVPIIDPGIANVTSYGPWDRGVESNAFIIDPLTNDPLIGKVWPGTCAFPDFFATNTSDYWHKELSLFHDMIEYDGIWIDMNEICNFCNGRAECTRRLQGKATNSFDPNNPPFNPLADSLDRTTIDMSSLHAHGTISEYNAHSLYGHMEAIATKESLETLLRKRAFVLTRSSFSGTGQYSAHWLGDNYSTFEFMRYSIAGALSMQLFGIPMTGADICGFSYNSTAELCARWTALGALGYPFARNHNGNKESSQEPYVFGDEYTEINRQFIKMRYALLPYLYSLMFKAHKYGDTVMRSMVFEFPSDSVTYDIDTQFMLGPALLISPVLESGVTQVTSYFPISRWFDFKTGIEIGGGYHTLDAPIDVIPLHLRGGCVLPLQYPMESLSTTRARHQAFHLIIALDYDYSSNGYIFWDDGEEIDSVDRGHYSDVMYAAKNSMINATSKNHSAINYFGDTYMQSIRVWGLPPWLKPSSAKLTVDGREEIISVVFMESQSSVTIWLGAAIKMSQSFTIELLNSAPAPTPTHTPGHSPTPVPRSHISEVSAVILIICGVILVLGSGIGMWKKDEIRRWISTPYRHVELVEEAERVTDEMTVEVEGVTGKEITVESPSVI